MEASLRRTRNNLERMLWQEATKRRPPAWGNSDTSFRGQAHDSASLRRTQAYVCSAYVLTSMEIVVPTMFLDTRRTDCMILTALFEECVNRLKHKKNSEH